MELRPYESGDCPAMERLFCDTVHAVCRRDYAPEQLDAWAPGEVDREVWDRSCLAHHTLVAVEDGEIVGFGDMDESGYLDRLYVRWDRQGRGIATALCGALEAACPVRPLRTHASLTARPFFEKRGYRVLRRQTVVRRGVSLDNFVMEKE